MSGFWWFVLGAGLSMCFFLFVGDGIDHRKWECTASVLEGPEHNRSDRCVQYSPKRNVNQPGVGE